MTQTTLNAGDHERIAAAIRTAEAETSGEIYCVVAHRSDGYFFAAAFAVMTGILLVSLAAAFALEYWWVAVRLPHFVIVQMLALAAACALLWSMPGLRIWLVPRNLLYRAAHDNALRQFYARNVHLTMARTGVLIFVSLAERYAEVVADAGIDAKVPQDKWDGIVADLIRHAGENRLADGFVAAISTVGNLLSAHFPVSEHDANELDDHLVEI
ncbi:TPM domain-containing protein [Aminobacter carboxidus]|uniref:TPM domain-containing protein n=1 Tax=Aminobacter carboxidus TaxID=376165 RepID=A0ABR9GLT5_9HYPH|nr:TPM domain-containing protein [Aminobacter carboxidus]MBE1204622.1 TPM domain-containing protein [Aminobacter carboxidus]